MNLKIGTRGSKLALAQAEQVKGLLEKAHPGLTCALEVIRTSGDDFSAGEFPLTQPSPHGGEGKGEGTALKGLFVKEIEEALLDGRVDLAVHSAKDMETELPAGLTLGAVLKREDPRDAWISTSGGLKELPAGSKVGASSLRRQAQLKRVRRDLEIVPIRGNVDTRLKKLDDGEVDALILAAAGLKRLGLESRVGQLLDTAQFLPAPCQGALAIEIRADRAEVAEKVGVLDDAGTRVEVEAERSMLKALGGSCRVPVGALAKMTDSHNMSLEGAVLSPDGLKLVRKTVAGSAKSARKLGIELASHLRAAGADRLLYGTWERK